MALQRLMGQINWGPRVLDVLVAQARLEKRSRLDISRTQESQVGFECFQTQQKQQTRNGEFVTESLTRNHVLCGTIDNLLHSVAPRSCRDLCWQRRHCGA